MDGEEEELVQEAIEVLVMMQLQGMQKWRAWMLVVEEVMHSCLYGVVVLVHEDEESATKRRWSDINIGEWCSALMSPRLSASSWANIPSSPPTKFERQHC
jgi:hypothetical protein